MTTDRPVEYGEYRVNRKIGKGGFGSVYLAENSLFPGHQFAVKVFATNEDTADTFTPLRDELTNLIGLAHTHIVQVRGFGIETRNGRKEPYIVMDFIEGPNGGSYNLKQHLVASGGRIEAAEIKRVFRQILSALSLVHKKHIAHLDLKPENILLDKELNAYVSDFGISQSVTSHSLRVDREPSIHGFSPIYASPEQIRHSYGSRHSDIFSLGIMLQECLTGRRPEVVHSPTHPRIEYTPPSREGFDAKWDALMERCLSIDPAYRFPNAEVFLRAMEQMPSTPGGQRRDLSAFVESTQAPDSIHIPTPRTPPRPSQPPLSDSTTPGPNINTSTTPLPGSQMARLLEKSGTRDHRGRFRDSDEEEQRVELSRSARIGVKILSIAGGLVGTAVGAFLGMNIGDAYGRSHADQMGRFMSLLLGRDLGGWIGRESGSILGALLVGTLGMGIGYVLFWFFGKMLYGALQKRASDGE